MTKNKLKTGQFLCTLIISCFFVASAFAEGQQGKQGISPNQGSDSCGLGWQVTDQKTLVGTSTRGTTNYFLSPSWSMTSGTSGCERHDFAKKDEEAVKYVASNYYPLRADMAQGGGEYVDGLARVLGCNDEASVALASVAQKNFKSLSRGTDAYEMLQKVRFEAQKNAVLSQGCSALTI